MTFSDLGSYSAGKNESLAIHSDVQFGSDQLKKILDGWGLILELHLEVIAVHLLDLKLHG